MFQFCPHRWKIVKKRVYCVLGNDLNGDFTLVLSTELMMIFVFVWSFRASCAAASSDTRIIFLRRSRSWVDCQWAARTLCGAAARLSADARSLSAAWQKSPKGKHTSIRAWMKPIREMENRSQTGSRDPDRSTVKVEVHGPRLRRPLTPVTTDREPSRCWWKKRRSCLGISYSCLELLVNASWFQEQASERAKGPCRVSTARTVRMTNQTSHLARACVRQERQRPRDRTPLTTSRCFPIVSNQKKFQSSFQWLIMTNYEMFCVTRDVSYQKDLLQEYTRSES